MLGSVIVLDSHGSRTKASELQRLLQSIPYALSAGGSDSDQEPGVQTTGVETLSLAGTLSWVIPNADCRMKQEFAMDKLVSLPLGEDQAMLDPHNLEHAVEVESRRL